MSQQDESTLTEEQKAIRDKLLRLAAEAEEKAGRFWKYEYSAMSRADRIARWRGSLYTGMRTQAVETGDKYTQFNPKWYQFGQSVDPDFDEIIEEAIKGLEGPFDWEEYRRRIKGPGMI